MAVGGADNMVVEQRLLTLFVPEFSRLEGTPSAKASLPLGCQAPFTTFKVKSENNVVSACNRVNNENHY